MTLYVMFIRRDDVAQAEHNYKFALRVMRVSASKKNAQGDAIW